MYSVLYNVLCHVPPHTDYPGHRRQGAPSPPSPQVRSPKTWVLSCKCNCVVVPETAIGIAHCILVHSHSGHRPSGCSLCSLLSVLSRFPALHLGLSSSWHIITLARSSLGPAAMLPFKRQLAHHEPRCARCSAPAPAPCSFIPLLLLFFLSHARAIPMPVRSTSRPTVPRQERTHHPPGIRCVRPMALAPLDILEA